MISNSTDDFYLQKAQSEVNGIATDINSAIRSGSAESVNIAPKGSLLLAKFPEDNQWYRCRVEKRLASGDCQVFFVDFGNTATIPAKDIRTCPKNLTLSAIPAQAIRCSLSACASSREFEGEAFNFFWEYYDAGTFKVTSERQTAGKRAVILEPKAGGASVNEELVKAGLCRVPKNAKSSILTTLTKLQEQAKRSHLAMVRFCFSFDTFFKVMYILCYSHGKRQCATERSLHFRDLFL